MTHDPIFLLLQLRNSKPYGMQIFTPHISKTHLPIHLKYVNSNWIDAQKTSQGKWESSSAWGVETQLPPQNLKIY